MLLIHEAEVLILRTILIAAHMVGTKDVFTFSLACAAILTILTALVPFKKLHNYDKKLT